MQALIDGRLDGFATQLHLPPVCSQKVGVEMDWKDRDGLGYLDGKSVQDVTPGCTIENAQGTVYMVSGSINHPRSDEEVSYGDNIGIGVEDISRIVYNVLDFTSDSITVHSYDYETGEEFNSFTLTKTDDASKPVFPFYRTLLRMFAGFCGKIYAFFNNFGRIYDLIEDGYDMSYATDILNNRNTVDGKSFFEDFRIPVC